MDRRGKAQLHRNRQSKLHDFENGSINLQADRASPIPANQIIEIIAELHNEGLVQAVFRAQRTHHRFVFGIEILTLDEHHADGVAGAVIHHRVGDEQDEQQPRSTSAGGV